jgi:tRNA(fMet)-specific endonuclease VapC
MKLSLDTNAYTKLMQGHRPLAEQLELADEIFISTVVLGELFGGFALGKKQRENARVLNDFIGSEAIVTEITRDIAERYGLIYLQLRSKGTPVPTNDLWIASAAFETGSRLVTYDSHFKVIPGLLVLSP